MTAPSPDGRQFDRDGTEPVASITMTPSPPTGHRLDRDGTEAADRPLPGPASSTSAARNPPTAASSTTARVRLLRSRGAGRGYLDHGGIGHRLIGDGHARRRERRVTR
jgi:hypothetical protein